MKISCLQENLKWGLSVVRSALPTKSIISITDNILVRVEQSKLRLTATDLEMALSCWITAKVEEEGEVACPAKFFIRCIENLPTDRVDLFTKGNAIHVECSKYKSHISVVDAKDYPPIPSVSDGMSFKMNAAELRDIISLVSLSTATDSSRPIFTGINIQWKGDLLLFAGADGFRLSLYRHVLSNPSNDRFDIVVPASSLKVLARLIADPEDTIEISLNASASRIQFKLKNIELVSSLIQGKYPDINRLIPTKFSTESSVEVAEFLRAINSAMVFSREGDEIVKVYINPGSSNFVGNITTKSTSEEVGANEGIIDSTVTGEERKIAFKGKLLTDVLTALKEGNIQIKTNSTESPVQITKIGNDKFIYVVMPMFIQW
jgi:DNA polymerase-3 subunit beta